VIQHGLFHDERLEKAMEIQKDTSAIFVHPFDDTSIIAGQWTIGLEIIEDLPDVDTVIVPVGGGGLISGIAIAIKNMKPSTRIIGVEPERASSMYQSFRTGRITRLSDTRSIADGLATREPGALTFNIARQNVDEILLVTEDEIEKAVFTIFRECHLVAEPSAAAVVAAMSKIKPKKGEKLAAVISGGNVSMKFLLETLEKYGQSNLRSRGHEIQ
jgi:threonine dehydratase